MISVCEGCNTRCVKVADIAPAVCFVGYHHSSMVQLSAMTGKYPSTEENEARRHLVA